MLYEVITSASGRSAMIAPVAVISLGRNRAEMAKPSAVFTFEFFNSEKNCWMVKMAFSPIIPMIMRNNFV